MQDSAQKQQKPKLLLLLHANTKEEKELEQNNTHCMILFIGNSTTDQTIQGT